MVYNRVSPTEDAAAAAESFRLELERCRSELDESRKRLGELEQAEVLLVGENRLLELVAKGEPLPIILNDLCRLVEGITDGSLCSILLLDEAGDTLWHVAGPSLPISYTTAVGSSAIGPASGPCGRAAYFKRQVIVSDIAADPLAPEYRGLALAHGLQACWSTPILSFENKVLGTFAILSREPRRPAPRHVRIIEQFTHLAAVAIERKRTEAALQSSEERFRRMADAIPEVMWFTSLEPEKVLYVSPSFERIWGLRVEDLYANPGLWTETIHPEDHERVAGTFARWIAGENVSYHDVEYRIVQPGGAVRWIHERGVLTHDENGKPCRVSGISTDITERKQAAEALRASEHLARGQLAALTRTLDSLAQESDPGNLPKHVVNTLLNQMDAHSATIWERNGDALDLLGIIEEGRFKTRGEAGYFEGCLPVNGPAPPLWVEALRTGAHVVIEDINKEPSRILLADGRTADWRAAELTAPFANLKRHLTAQGVRGLLVSPMMLAGQLAGLIGIRFTGTRVFGCDEIELIQALAHQAMLTMQLMRLSQQSRDAAVIAERNRVARDIHDTLAQGFTGVIMQLEAAKGATAHGDLTEVATRIERASELARSSLGEARRSVRALRPKSLRDGKLFVAVDNLLKRMTEGTDLNAEFQGEGDERSIPADWEEGLLRITQEALTNAVKHAHARNFRATLNAGADKIQLRLVDDGRGFDPQMEYEGFGLIGMRERADQMNGDFLIRAKPGVGTEVLVELKNITR